jgi:hypothetical protein
MAAAMLSHLFAVTGRVRAIRACLPLPRMRRGEEALDAWQSDEKPIVREN